MNKDKASTKSTSENKVYSDANSCPFFVSETPQGMKKAILRHLETSLARDRKTASIRDWWVATALSVRDHIMERFIKTMNKQYESDARRVYYFSLEYLVGRLTEDVLVNTHLLEPTKKALEELGISYDEVIAQEVDMGLGNGGLGRLAAGMLPRLARNAQLPRSGLRHQIRIRSVHAVVRRRQTG